NATCTLSVTFNPTSSGNKDASLSVTTTQGGSATASLTGKGLAPAMLQFTPTTSYDFGTVNVGSTAAAVTFKLTNSGDLTTSTISTSTSGMTAEFGITNGCNGITLAAAATCSVTVSFSPTVWGTQSFSLTATAATGGSAMLSVS